MSVSFDSRYIKFAKSSSEKTYSDNFQGWTLGDLQDQGSWICARSSGSINVTNTSGDYRLIPANATEVCLYWNAGFSNNQSSKVKLDVAANAAGKGGVAVRCSGTSDATSNYYSLYGNGQAAGTVELAVTVNGTKTTIASCTLQLSAADTLKLTINGSILTCYRNDSIITTMGAATGPATGNKGVYYDTRLTTGQPGVAMSGATGTDCELDDFQADDVTGYISSYQLVYNSFTNKPSASDATKQNAMVKSLIEGGFWSRMDLLYIMANHSSSAGEHRKNWLNPGTFDFEATALDSSWVQYEGLTGNGTNYPDTSYNPSTQAIYLSKDSATLGVYIRSDSNTDVYQVGAVAGSDQLSFEARDTGNFYTRINSATALSAASSSAVGFWLSTRTGSTAVACYKNGSSAGSSSAASTTVPNATVTLFARSGGLPCSNQISIILVMNGITGTDATNLTNIFETYMDAIGKGVIA
jgi:hypothetical protein